MLKQDSRGTYPLQQWGAFSSRVSVDWGTIYESVTGNPGSRSAYILNPLTYVTAVTPRKIPLFAASITKSSITSQCGLRLRLRLFFYIIIVNGVNAAYSEVSLIVQKKWGYTVNLKTGLLKLF